MREETISLLRENCSETGEFKGLTLLQAGDTVRVNSGPLHDLIGTIEKTPGTERIWLVVDYMGGARKMQVNRSHVDRIVSP